MPTYTNSVNVLALLPTSPPTEVTDYTAADIASASQLIESGVGPNFAFNYESNAQKFPDITSTPATPAIIELVARYMAASLQFIRLKESVGEDEQTFAERYRQLAEEKLQQIRNGEVTVDLEGTNLMTTALIHSEDEIYEDLDEDQKPILNHDDIDTHLYD